MALEQDRTHGCGTRANERVRAWLERDGGRPRRWKNSVRAAKPQDHCWNFLHCLPTGVIVWIESTVNDELIGPSEPHQRRCCVASPRSTTRRAKTGNQKISNPFLRALGARDPDGRRVHAPDKEAGVARDHASQRGRHAARRAGTHGQNTGGGEQTAIPQTTRIAPRAPLGRRVNFRRGPDRRRVEGAVPGARSRCARVVKSVVSRTPANASSPVPSPSPLAPNAEPPLAH